MATHESTKYDKKAERPMPTKRRSLYPPGHRQSDDPYYLDDTLDAYPPYHLFHGKPTPEAMEAAKRLAAERGYPSPKFPPESHDSRDGQGVHGASTGAAEPDKRAARKE